MAFSPTFHQELHDLPLSADEHDYLLARLEGVESRNWCYIFEHPRVECIHGTPCLLVTTTGYDGASTVETYTVRSYPGDAQ